MRVATFNIQHGAKGDYGHGYPELVAEACKELDADILGLQEVDVGVPRSEKADLASVAAEAADMDVVFAKARTFRGRGRYGNALLVRGEIDAVEVIRLRGDYHTAKVGGRKFKLVPEPRNAIVAHVNVEGQQLAVGVTHLGGDKRKQQLGQVAAALSERSGPQLLLGDMNLHLNQVQSCLAPYDLTAIKGPNTSEAWNPRQQIDHIAINGFLRVFDVHTHRRFAVSDHLALVADIEFAI